jgi:hypothetical protein
MIARGIWPVGLMPPKHGSHLVFAEYNGQDPLNLDQIFVQWYALHGPVTVRQFTDSSEPRLLKASQRSSSSPQARSIGMFASSSSDARLSYEGRSNRGVNCGANATPHTSAPVERKIDWWMWIRTVARRNPGTTRFLCHHATFVKFDQGERAGRCARQRKSSHGTRWVRAVATIGASRTYRCLRNTVVTVDTFGGFDSPGAPGPP